jgi:hypothetical protein
MITKQKVVVGSVLGAMVIGVAIIFFGFTEEDSLRPDEQSYTITSTSSAATRNDTYAASVDYRVPAPVENSLTVTLTIVDGTITEADIKNISNNSESVRYAARFINSYKTEVIGKKLTDVSLSRVGGASLTSNAFNTALTAIKAQVG